MEESLLGTHRSTKGSKKRPAPDDAYDSGSEIDVPIAVRHGHGGRPSKVRKTEGHMQDITADLEASLAGEISMSTIAIKPLPAGGKGRGKGKQRDDQVDSPSGRGRKKPGPKKKLDVLPPHTQEALGLTGSASISTSRDASPMGSRASSPALTNVSATIYELDDEIPALKKAKRIDDAGMWKRVKTLEETQRKVWTNIARKDVVKVCP